MIILRPAEERFHTQIEWLDSHHSFSFGEHHDPKHMGFRALRVINDDRVQAGQGFGRHPHRDMEIISYVLEGALSHQDSMGNGSVIKPGDVQRMSAGTGVFHSEANPSKSEAVHFLQIWLLPEKNGIAPGYEQKTFSAADKDGHLKLVASRDGREGSVTIHQDASVYAGVFAPGQKQSFPLPAGRHAWVHVASGTVSLNGRKLQAGDGAGISEESAIELAGGPGEVLLFDLA